MSHARSGNLLWDVAYADWNKNYGATSALWSLMAKFWWELRVAMTASADLLRPMTPRRENYCGAFGRFRSRRPGSESWPGDMYLHGGGTTWMPGHLRPRTEHRYGERAILAGFQRRSETWRRHYTCSVVALDADTGKPKWYFQFTPHDLYDYDPPKPRSPLLVDRSLKGSAQALVKPTANGFVYV